MTQIIENIYKKLLFFLPYYNYWGTAVSKFLLMHRPCAYYNIICIYVCVQRKSRTLGYPLKNCTYLYLECISHEFSRTVPKFAHYYLARNKSFSVSHVMSAPSQTLRFLTFFLCQYLACNEHKFAWITQIFGTSLFTR